MASGTLNHVASLIEDMAGKREKAFIIICKAFFFVIGLFASLRLFSIGEFLQDGSKSPLNLTGKIPPMDKLR